MGVLGEVWVPFRRGRANQRRRVWWRSGGRGPGDRWRQRGDGGAGGSGLAVSFAAGPATVCTTSGTDGATITLVGAGTCTVTVSQNGDASYRDATPVTRVFAVRPVLVGLTVTATGPSTVTPGTGTYPPGPLTLTATPTAGAVCWL